MPEQAVRTVVFGGDQATEFIGGPDNTASQQSICFGHFRVRPGARSLECKGRQLQLGSRAFDLLMVLLRSRGEVVTKEEIMRYVWPTTIVEDANLRVQMTSLRRALGCDGTLIKTISGRGYMAAAEKEFSGIQIPTAPPPMMRTNLTPPVEGKPSIVIIDRNAENREAIHRLLQPFNADVRSFVSVEAFFLSRASSAQGLEWRRSQPQQ